MAWAGLDEHRNLGGAPVAAHLRRVAAARVERAAGRHVDQAGRRAAGSGAAAPAAPVEPRHRAEQAPGVGVPWLEEHVAAVPCSATRPAYMTRTSSATSATTPRSWVMMMIAEPNSRLQVHDQVEDLGLDGDVERGGRLVGDQQLRVAGQRHRDHRALPHAAGELVRVVVDPDRRAAGCRPGRAARWRACARPAWTPCCAPGTPRDLGADRVVRVQRGQRVLEDHRHLAAAQLAHPFAHSS